jgi:hypothetical protein
LIQINHTTLTPRLPQPAPLMPVRYVEIGDDGSGNTCASNIYSMKWDISCINTCRDANGREVGRSTTNARGNTIYRDNMARNTGRSVTDARGDTTFHHAMGRRTGTTKGR